MMTGFERYHRDVQFRNLVNTMRASIVRHDYTPSEMRDAAMVASILVEQDKPLSIKLEGDRLTKHFPELVETHDG